MNEACYESLISDLKKYLWTGLEFNSRLRELIDREQIEGIQYNITRTVGSRKENYTYGHEGLRECDMQETHKYSDDIAVVTMLWFRDSALTEKDDKERIKKYVQDIIENFLNVFQYHANSLLPVVLSSTGTILDKCEATLQRMLQDGKKVAVFMLDLDHFKQVNDTYDHDTGGLILREFGDILLKACWLKAIAVNRSGDEFNIIYPYDSAAEVIELAEKIRTSAKEHKYQKAQELRLTAAQGICLMEKKKSKNLRFQEASRLAESAYYPKEKNKEKQRDSIRMILGNSSKKSPRGTDSKELVYVYVMSNTGKRNIFFNAYLDYFSIYAGQEADIERLKSQIEKILEWITPNYVPGMRVTADTPNWDCREEFSLAETGFSFFSGLMQNPACQGKDIKLSFYEGEDGVSLEVEGKSVLELGKLEGEPVSYEIKGLGAVDNCKYGGLSGSKAILIRIGYEKINIPESCFAHIVRVDKRPTTGGGLPDFWAATLSELIGYLQSNPHISDVIVYGKRDYAKNLCRILEDTGNWGNDKGDDGKGISYSFLVRKTNRTLDEVIDCQKRLVGHIFFADESEDGIAARLYQIHTNYERKKNIGKAKKLPIKRFLNRELAYDALRLNIEDGCRVKSLDEAFPTVLEILRNRALSKERNRIIDQAGRELIELPNFKIILEEPDSRDIPEYYNEEKADLEDYYDNVLEKPEALFQKELEADQQLETVLKHVAALIDNSGLRYATRRAILVIPHKILGQENMSPLGLVSIWMSPRQIGDKIVLDFSYTWRTVEAMIGLPYSMYASVRYSEYLADMVRKKSGISEGSMIKLGSISYIAYSLHMFLDESYTEIVRGVINEASK